jgi:hypothetical protein
MKDFMLKVITGFIMLKIKYAEEKWVYLHGDIKIDL